MHRLLDSHESEIAWREGELVEAKRHLEAARARKDLLAYGTWRDQHIAHVDALYALVLALRPEGLFARVVARKI